MIITLGVEKVIRLSTRGFMPDLAERRGAADSHAKPHTCRLLFASVFANGVAAADTRACSLDAGPELHDPRHVPCPHHVAGWHGGGGSIAVPPPAGGLHRRAASSPKCARSSASQAKHPAGPRPCLSPR
jgi:hypothetical protein